MIKTVLSYWKSILSVVVILYLSFAPPSDFSEMPKVNILFFDKIVHVALYVFLTIVLIFDYRNHNKLSKTNYIYIAQCILFPIVMGGCIEIAQDKWFYPRTAEWVDWLADILGVTIALVVTHFYKRKIQG
jgi:VanZ family protein